MLARSYAVLDDQPASRAPPAPGAAPRSRAPPSAVGRAPARRVRREALRLALAHRDPGAVPDPALQRARRAARPARALPRRARPAPVVLRAAPATSGASTTACCGARSCGAVRRWLVLNRAVVRELRRFRPDAVAVGGWNQPAFWLALAYCRLRRIPLLVWIECTARDARSEARPLELARAAMVRAGVEARTSPGQRVDEYARSLGVELDRDRAERDRRVGLRRAAVDRSGRDGCTFLYVGRLDPEKGLDMLLEAFRERARRARARRRGQRRASGCAGSPANACGSRAPWTATSSSPSTATRTSSSCRRARSPGGWC